MRRNWLQAYDFASGRGAIFLGEYARARQPFARIGEQTASVQVTSVLRASNRSFQVKWTEREYARGSQTGSSRWKAILTIVSKVPRTAATRSEEGRVGEEGVNRRELRGGP